jgi:hypothetical protein
MLSISPLQKSNQIAIKAICRFPLAARLMNIQQIFQKPPKSFTINRGGRMMPRAQVGKAPNNHFSAF